MYEELVKDLRENAERYCRHCTEKSGEHLCGYKGDQYCFSKTLLDAADAIEELQKPQWIPVTERLPEPTYAREWYLVALESGCVKTLAFEKSGRSDNLFKDGWHETASPVAHWMPLPTPPKEETE